MKILIATKNLSKFNTIKNMLNEVIDSDCVYKNLLSYTNLISKEEIGSNIDRARDKAKDAYNQIDEKFDAIIHIAGQSSGEISFDDPVYDLQTNTQSTVMLLKLAQKTGCKKFVYASSMSVYGDHQPPECKEETEKVPKSFYAVGKLASENYMRIFSEYGIACTALRFFNVYGPGQNLSNLRQGMASIFLAMAIKDHHIHVKGSKDRFRDFVYIDDVVDAVLRSLNREKGYDVFNVCTGVATTVENVVKSICDALPYDVTVEYKDGTPGDQFGIYGNNEKIIKALDWKVTRDFSQGMKDMIDWALTQKF